MCLYPATISCICYFIILICCSHNKCLHTSVFDLVVCSIRVYMLFLHISRIRYYNICCLRSQKPVLVSVDATYLASVSINNILHAFNASYVVSVFRTQLLHCYFITCCLCSPTSIIKCIYALYLAWMFRSPAFHTWIHTPYENRFLFIDPYVCLAFRHTQFETSVVGNARASKRVCDCCWMICWLFLNQRIITTKTCSIGWCGKESVIVLRVLWLVVAVFVFLIFNYISFRKITGICKCFSQLIKRGWRVMR